jgi:FAD/FMN-containing dehydrogenase
VNPRYLEDASGLRGNAERALTPENEAAVAAALRQASAAGVPVTICGAGTGVAGGAVPRGGWALSLERLMRLEIHPGYAIVGAGVLLRDLHAAARASGQFYPPDPTETSSSLGGNIATNASGSRSFLYGSTRRWVERLRVVLAGGRTLDVGRGDAIDFGCGSIALPAVSKNTAGYPLRPGMDWIDLFIGSEGTLGVVTEARLRLLPEPAAFMAGVIFFPDDERALNAVDTWRSAGLRMLEYMDANSLETLRPRYAEIPAKARAALLIESELKSGEDPALDEWIDRVEASGALAGDSWFALSAADRERFRVFRHALPEIVNEAVRRKGSLKMSTDFAVPTARNREMLAYYQRRLEGEFPGRHVIFGHIGDAHLHINLLPAPEEQPRGAALFTEFARQAVALGGTVSAEHGLGKRKAHLLSIQYSDADIEKMRAVKRRLDPAEILGRGTLFG